MRRLTRALASLGGIAALMSTQLATAAPAQAQTYDRPSPCSARKRVTSNASGSSSTT